MESGLNSESFVRRAFLKRGKPRVALSSSRNAVRISSARTTKRWPSRCASPIQIVRPSQSTAAT